MKGAEIPRCERALELGYMQLLAAGHQLQEEMADAPRTEVVVAFTDARAAGDTELSQCQTCTFGELTSGKDGPCGVASGEALARLAGLICSQNDVKQPLAPDDAI